MRKITSMTMLISFVVLIINSIILYIVPEGRVAYWADWRFWGLTKTEWGDQHVTIGFLFLLSGFLHLFYNWAVVKSYLKNKVKEMKIFTLPFNVGLLLTAVIIVMTYFHVPPVSLILQLGTHFKVAGAEKHGEPPYGHAERSSLKMFCQKEGIDLEKALSLLKQEGLQVANSEVTLLAIAQEHNLTPQQVSKIIAPAKKSALPAKMDKTVAQPFPDMPKPGFGRKTLENACAELQIDYAATVKGLQEKGLKIMDGKTIHEIAAANGKEPMAIFEAIRAVVLKE
jgi:hypothetical protein